MKITNVAIAAITPRTRSRIALALDVSEPTVYRWVKDNETNSDLTKPTVTKIIEEETGLKPEQILETENA